jgi:hypothetical protein
MQKTVNLGYPNDAIYIAFHDIQVAVYNIIFWNNINNNIYLPSTKYLQICQWLKKIKLLQ